MPLVATHELRADVVRPDNQQVYNGLDSCITLEVFEELQTLFSEPPAMYAFERALQAPALEMMLRGFKVNSAERSNSIRRLKDEIVHLDTLLQNYALAVWDKPLNPRSSPQCKAFFYGAMRIPEVITYQKGERKISMNRETLEKLDAYLHARPIIACILAIRERDKLLSVLETEIDSDGRMRTSYNIAGTETWRWSSSANAYGTGTNLQNITPELRKMFVADRGWRLFGIDLEQAESREVGYLCGTLFGDWKYLDACERGDLHTTACQLIWPQEAWSGDPRYDRAIADQPFYRHFSKRDMAKRGGHASNYYGTPFTISRHLKVPQTLIDDFQQRYFEAFPAISKWHRWVAQQLETTRAITTPFGSQRLFFGREREDATLREAIAFSPQSSTAVRMNLGAWRVWRYMPEVQLLAQVHDAIYWQAPEDADHNAIAKKALSLISVPLHCPGGRTFDVPGEIKIGWNWAAYCCGDRAKCPKCKLPTNPDGLRKLNGTDERKRLEGLEYIL
jgi:DNA polymerase I-like protein with 3'-5' exonuclease and polymerase domains